MGMFDDVRCLYPLPWPKVQDAVWQSKCTPAQFCDQYEIRADGTLWHQAYDVRIEETDKAPLGFFLHQDNPRWEQVPWDGELEIHKCIEHNAYLQFGGTFYSARLWFRDGVVRDMITSKTTYGEQEERRDGNT